MKPTKQHYKFNYFEPLIIIAFWALLFTSPLLFGRFEDVIDWGHIFKVWINYLPLLVVFLINRFFLLPKLFFKGKKTIYFISTVTLIIFTTLAFYSFEINNSSNRNTPSERIENLEFQNTSPRFLENRPPPPNKRENRPQPIPAYANFLILAVLLVGFDAGLQISMRWSSLEQEKFKLQKENVENQLVFLKNQISPHFFMNTLNNIHALVDLNTETAKNSIIKLSNLMRHLLYDSEEKTNSIKKEIEFIESYIELMKLRFSDKVKININIPSKIPEKSIPPLLFTSLLENAFKHGISYKLESYINVSLSFSKNKLNFEVENSIHTKKGDESSSGIGIENTKKRLTLLYKNDYILIINTTEKVFRVNLTIPI
tara:strand:+ start:1734 stop:2846 length:1113 start_codon:yes stop_codon:yes gene_type:complete